VTGEGAFVLGQALPRAPCSLPTKLAFARIPARPDKTRVAGCPSRRLQGLLDTKKEKKHIFDARYPISSFWSTMMISVDPWVRTPIGGAGLKVNRPAKGTLRCPAELALISGGRKCWGGSAPSAAGAAMATWTQIYKRDRPKGFIPHHASLKLFQVRAGSPKGQTPRQNKVRRFSGWKKKDGRTVTGKGRRTNTDTMVRGGLRPL